MFHSHTSVGSQQHFVSSTRATFKFGLQPAAQYKLAYAFFHADIIFC